MVLAHWIGLALALSLAPAGVANLGLGPVLSPPQGPQGESVEDAPTAPLSVEQYLAQADKRLSKHFYFARAPMVRELSPKGVALYLQRPALEGEGWRAPLVAAHAEWFERMAAAFDERFAKPLGLTRRDDLPCPLVCVLATHGDYVNYAEAMRTMERAGEAAHFERRSNLTVTWHSGGKPLATRRQALLAEFVEGLIEAHYRGGPSEMWTAWAKTAIVRYLCGGVGAAPASLDAFAPQASDLAALAELVQHPRLRDVYLIPIAELSECVDVGAQWRAVSARGEGLRIAVEGERFWRTWNAECALWMHYLLDAAGPQRRAAVLHHLAAALRARVAKGSFARAFEGQDLLALDREFYAWVLVEHHKRAPAAKVDLAAANELFRARPKPAAEGAEGNAVAAPAPASSAPSSFDPAALAPAAEDVRAHHAAALHLARSGQLDAAHAALEALLARAGEPSRARIAAELERVAALRVLRTKVLEALVASGAKTTLVVGERKLVGRVIKHEDGVVTVAPTRGEPEAIAIEEFSLEALLRSPPKDVAASDAAWIRPYVALLAGDERGARRSKDGDERLARLAQDAPGYADLTALGPAAAALVELANSPAPWDSASGAECLQRLRALMAQHAEVELVRARREPLRRLAELAAQAYFDEFEAVSAMRRAIGAKNVTIGRDESPSSDAAASWRLAATLDFESLEQAAAFVSEPARMADFRQSFGALPATNAWSIERGKLRLDGSQFLRFAVPLAAPLRVSVRVSLADSGAPGPFVFVVLADLRSERDFAGVALNGGLVLSTDSEREYPGWTAHDVYSKVVYQVELELAGAVARGRVNGVERAQGPRQSAAAGDVVLLTHSAAPLELEELTLEGVLSEADLRSFWLRAQLRELGL